MPARYGSDLIVDLMKLLGMEYVALNPGSSFRGIHDSLVNYESGQKPNPEMILCCHEEIAVAVAHGYFKATGKIMPAIVHNVVGLQTRLDGDLQRVVRPHAGDGHGRHRADELKQAPAVDR